MNRLAIIVLAIVVVGVATAWRLFLPLGNAGAPTGRADGAALYAQFCAQCHGAQLEGQPDWRRRLANGRLPAPPHNASGHTWHHPEEQLFGITKFGIGAFAPPGYESDMPAFEGALSDDQIRAILGFIRDSWPPEIRASYERISRQAKP
ncbi:MAG: cytochrome c [Rhodospirillales bacterium]|nr:cytochrome c [Rhodospirillales bacterium]